MTSAGASRRMARMAGSGGRMKLQGKVAIVTGAAQGMGRAIAMRYAQEGASVVVADLNQDTSQATADEITGAGGRAVAVRVDVRDRQQVQAMVDAAVTAFGGVDVLVNNAGVGKIIPFLDTTEQDW